MGHRNPQVTQDVYIAMTHAQRRQMVDCPWLRHQQQAAEEDVLAQGRAMATAICSPFGSADGRTFPTLCFETSRPTVTQQQQQATTVAAVCVEHDGPRPKKRRRLLDLMDQYLREEGR